MRRIVFLFTTIFLTGPPCGLQAQISTWFGEVRYQQQYHEMLREQTSIDNRMSPQVTLGFSGYVVTPYLATFSLRSTAGANYYNLKTPYREQSFSQLALNLYDLSIDVLQGYMMGAQYSSREYRLETRGNDAYRFREGLVGYRERRHVATVTARRVPFLPQIMLQYQRTRNWSDITTISYDRTYEEYFAVISKATETSSVMMSASLFDQQDASGAIAQTYKRVNFQGNKDFSRAHRFSLASEFYVTGEYRSLTANGLYFGFETEPFRIQTSLYGRNHQTGFSQGTSAGINQTFQILPDEHFQLSVNLFGETGRDVQTTPQGTEAANFHSYGPSGSVSHTRPIGPLHMTNTLGGGYLERRSMYSNQTASANYSNSLTLPLDWMALTATQGMSLGRVAGFDAHETQANTANVSLSMQLPLRITSQSMADFQDTRRMKTDLFAYRRQELRIQQIVNGFVDLLIPMNIGGAATWNFYRYDLEGRTFGWNIYANSPRFFLNSLIVGYRLQVQHDIYMRRNNQEQSLEMTYFWRSVSIQLKLTEIKALHRKRELWLNVIRPF